MPEIDWTRDAKKPSELAAIVEYIADTPDFQETSFLEWKAGYDISTKSGAGKTAKQLIGFANRDPDRAAETLEGNAYLLFGVEAGTTRGISTFWDSADVESWLSPFLQEELTYEINYLNVRGTRQVLFKVGPPRQGHPIFALQKSTGDGGENLAEGTIYVRHGSKTEPHSAQDLVRLTERAKSKAPDLSLVVSTEALNLRPLDEEILSGPGRDRYLEHRRNRLLRGMPKPTKIGPLDVTVPSLSISELRTESEFLSEIEHFVNEANRNWEDLCICKHIKHAQPSVIVVVDNRTDENFEAVVVEVTIPLPRSRVHSGLSNAEEYLDPPQEPRTWDSGIASAIDIASWTVGESVSDPSLEELDSETTRLRFKPFHSYPRTPHRLPAISIVLFPDDNGLPLACEWRAVAKNTKGEFKGQTRIHESVDPIDHSVA